MKISMLAPSSSSWAWRNSKVLLSDEIAKGAHSTVLGTW